MKHHVAEFALAQQHAAFAVTLADQHLAGLLQARLFIAERRTGRDRHTRPGLKARAAPEPAQRGIEGLSKDPGMGKPNGGAGLSQLRLECIEDVVVWTQGAVFLHEGHVARPADGAVFRPMAVRDERVVKQMRDKTEAPFRERAQFHGEHL